MPSRACVADPVPQQFERLEWWHSMKVPGKVGHHRATARCRICLACGSPRDSLQVLHGLLRCLGAPSTSHSPQSPHCPGHSHSLRIQRPSRPRESHRESHPSQGFRLVYPHILCPSCLGHLSNLCLDLWLLPQPSSLPLPPAPLRHLRR